MDQQNSLSTIDMIIIRQQLSKLPDAAIAEMISQPVNIITDIINKITGGGVIRKSKSQILFAKALSTQKNKNEKPKSFERKISISAGPRKLIEPKYQTKITNYSEKVLTRIDSKTSIYINAGENIEKAKEKYLKQIERSREFMASNDNKPVKEKKKLCGRCLQKKVLKEFESDKTNPDGLARHCKQCKIMVKKIKASK